MMWGVLRKVGTFLVVAGLGLLVWALVVWRWQDPFTALYTTYEQRQLAASYESRAAEFERTASSWRATARADVRSELAAAARRYRKAVDAGDAIGRLRVPRLDLDIVLVNGTGTNTLKKGPGRYLGSYMPGEGELVYVAGHRTTYLAPFARIDALRRGDRVSVQMPYGTFEYRVSRDIIVPATAVEVLK